MQKMLVLKKKKKDVVWGERQMRINVKEKKEDGLQGLSLLLSTSLGSSGHHVEGFFFEKKGKKTHICQSLIKQTANKICDSPEPALNQPH